MPIENNMIHIIVNGERLEIPDQTTVRQLTAQFKMVPEKVAIERNRRLVRAGHYDDLLADGDQVEIVTFVGGG